MRRKWKITAGVFVVLFCMLIGCEKKREEELLLVSIEEQDGSIEDSEKENEDTKLPDYAEETLKEVPSEAGKEEQKAELVVVHICGAVQEPGVYSLKKGSRLYQAVEIAGGFLEDAGEEYLNLADLLTDGEKIYIPTEQEAESENRSKESGSAVLTRGVDSNKININTASEELLCTLPGVGSSKAKSIIVYRETYGAFQTTEEIMNVEGIKDGVFQKIKDMIMV